MTDIAIFIPSLNGGGAEKIMVTLANAFSGRGYSVDLVMASATGPYLGDVSDSVRIVDLDAGRVIKALLPLARYLSREKPVAMLSAMGHSNIIAILARMLARASTRLVISERNTISIQYEQSHGIWQKLLYKLIPILYPKADAICGVSQSVSSDLERFANLPISAVITIYNPFDLHTISRLSAKPPDYLWFEDNKLPIILAIGRLTEQKGFFTLIQAFSILKRTHHARLLILGDGELRKNLESYLYDCGLSDNNVQMPGFVSNPFSYLARCRMFVLSSQWEGLPGVLIQAMACGAPVVSTNCMSGPDEILEGGRWGRLVPVGDVQALAKAMEEVLDLPREKLPDVRLRAQDFAQDKAVDAYLELLGFTKT